MRESRKDGADESRQDDDGQGTSGTSSTSGAGRRVDPKLEKEFETRTGHPPGGSSASAAGDEQMPVDMPPDPSHVHGQHDRKGQAQSPRELNLNQPEKKREGH